MKVKRRNPKRSGAATSYATSTNSKLTDPNVPEQSPERQLMEDKFVVYDYTKPDENETRRKLIEQNHWAQRMNKTTGEKHGLHPNNAYGSTRKAGGTYKASVLDYLNQKPSTPLSAGDILKLEELARTARNTNGREKGNDWRPPSGLMGNNAPDGSPLEAMQARDEYILLNGGVPPPSKPPPLSQPYNSGNYRNDRHHALNKTSQDYSPSSFQTRRSSDDSYRLASSPDNSEYPLMASVAALGEEYNVQQPNNNVNNYNHNNSNNTNHNTNNNNQNNNNNNITKVYSSSITSSVSSHTLHEPSRSSNTTNTVSTTNSIYSRPPPARISSIPRIHGNPLPPPSSLPPPIPSELPPLPPLPQKYN